VASESLRGAGAGALPSEEQLRGFEDFYLEAKAGIWPWLSCVRQTRSTVAFRTLPRWGSRPRKDIRSCTRYAHTPKCGILTTFGFWWATRSSVYLNRTNFQIILALLIWALFSK